MGWPEPEDFRDAEPFIRRRWEAGFERHQQAWRDIRDAYRFGWEWGRSRTLTGATWTEVEPQLRRRWRNTVGPNAPEWDAVRGVVWDAFHFSRQDSWAHDWTRKTW